jgi:tetratricopeptide (TPR) repeat protein
MDWKNNLKQFEDKKKWDSAIELMENVIKDNPNSLEAYLNICYLLMNLLVEEDYDEKKHDYYAKLTKKYFDESHTKFTNNPEYLYFIGRIACMSEWYFGIEIEDANQMLKKATQLDPENLIYKWDYYASFSKENPFNPEVINYANIVLQANSPIAQLLNEKGSLGKYILGMMKHWSKNIIEGKNLYY